MNEFGLSFHHLGLAVQKKEQAVKFLSGTGYQVAQPIYDTNQEVNLIMCTSPTQPDVEIVFPSEKEGPLDNILKSQDSLIYHTCYESTDIDASVRKIKACGLRVVLVSDKKEAILFNNKLVAFYYIKGMGLIEILEVSGGAK